MEKPLLLSCCMIVKNEEEFLARCLESVKPYVDEIVIVDTGSQDRTVEIARNYTERIFFHAWENDFSKHRNQSISYAQGEWILQIDADEELAPGSGEAIRRLLQAAGAEVNSLMVNITDIDQKGRPRATFNFPRVFRNKVGIHYEGIVHNQVVGSGKCLPCPAVIRHYGYYLDQEKMEAKRRRSIPLLLKQLEENPQNTFALYNLANMHLGMKDYAKVIEYAQKALGLLRSQDTVPVFYISLYSPLIHACIRENRIRDARRHAEDSIEIYPGFLDGHYLLNEIAFLEKDWEMVIKTGEKALDLYQKISEAPSRLGSVVCFHLNSRGHLYLRTGAALLRQGKPQEASEMFRLALEDHPQPDSALRFILNLTEECGAEELYRGFLSEATRLYPGDVLFRRLELKKLIEEDQDRSKALELFDILSRLDPDEDWGLRKGIFLLEKGCLGDAERVFGERLRTGPPRAQIHSYLGLARELMGDLPGASEEHEKAVALDSSLTYSWMKLGEYSMAAEEWEAALARFRKAQEEGARGPELLLRLAIVALRLGDVRTLVEALDQLLLELGIPNQRTLESMEELADLFQEIGQALDQTRQRKLATEAFGIAAELDPSKAFLALEAAKRFLAMRDPKAAASQLASLIGSVNQKNDLLKDLETTLGKAALGV